MTQQSWDILRSAVRSCLGADFWYALNDLLVRISVIIFGTWFNQYKESSYSNLVETEHRLALGHLVNKTFEASKFVQMISEDSAGKRNKRFYRQLYIYLWQCFVVVLWCLVCAEFTVCASHWEPAKLPSFRVQTFGRDSSDAHMDR